MVWSILADAVLLVHAAFIAWALLGAASLMRWPRLIWLHLPALAWGVWIELSGGICPLTPLEQTLRARAGLLTTDASFIDRFLGPLIYPQGLTPEVQVWLAGVLVAVNAILYGLFYLRRRRTVR